MRVNTSETHQVDLVAHLDWSDLKELIYRHVLSGMPDVVVRQMFGELSLGEVDVKIEQLTEGSPEYSVQRWRAVVRAGKDLAPF